MLRAVVTYDAVTENEPASYELTFECDLHGHANDLKLVEKKKCQANR